jgi:CspA family cold shock protein
MLYFIIELANSNAYVFKGDRVPSEDEALVFFLNSPQGKEAVVEANRLGGESIIKFTQEITPDEARKFWDLDALEALGDNWAYFDGFSDIGEKQGVKRGTVKWVNTEIGFGLITDEDGIDIYVRFLEVITDEPKVLSAGEKVEFQVEANQRGFYAANVVKL